MKEDGISITRYPIENGYLWLTRGKNGIGADVSDIFNNHKEFNINSVFNEYAIKFEAIMTSDQLSDYKKITKKDFNNGRSAVAGILSNKNGAEYYKYISLIPLDIIDIKTKRKLPAMARSLRLDKLPNDRNILSYRYSLIENIKNLSIDDIILNINKIYKYLEKLRKKSEWDSDGIVIEVVPYNKLYVDVRKDDKSEFQCAVKFPSEEQESTLIDVEWYFGGHTGILTPVAIFEPIFFNGNKCIKASLSNYMHFKELYLKKGDVLHVKYSNDVLSYITDVENIGTDKIEVPKRCPICKNTLKIDGDFLKCINKECDGRKIGRIKNWLVKIGVKGIKENTVKELFDLGLVKNISDLYNKNFKNKLLSQADSTNKKELNIIKAIDEKKKIKDWEFLGSLGIDGVGRKKFKLILEKYSLNDIVNINSKFANEIITNVKGIEKLTVDKIYAGMVELRDEIKKILNSELEVIEIKKNESNKETINVCFTGVRPSKELEEKMSEKGYKSISGVSKNTKILVLKDINSTSEKTKKANDLGIKIIEFNKFIEMVNK